MSPTIRLLLRHSSACCHCCTCGPSFPAVWIFTPTHNPQSRHGQGWMGEGMMIPKRYTSFHGQICSGDHQNHKKFAKTWLKRFLRAKISHPPMNCRHRRTGMSVPLAPRVAIAALLHVTNHRANERSIEVKLSMNDQNPVVRLHLTRVRKNVQRNSYPCVSLPLAHRKGDTFRVKNYVSTTHS